ncbi:MAG: hypothetical protein EBW30_05540 [Synechococcaceae bacterium WB7_3xG_012]|jgi:hypothetical protein|nr:Rho termination factor N-terminal domain-containing protein [Cyanobacteriota bacterium]NCV92258.1 hypothetical protein [Synechococcaceae bacterium WB7_3xG_012]
MPPISISPPMQEITFAIEAALITGGSLALLTLASRVPAAADQALAAPPAPPKLDHRPSPRTQLEGQTVVQLQQLARARGLSGVSRLRKADLIEELLSA